MREEDEPEVDVDMISVRVNGYLSEGRAGTSWSTEWMSLYI